MNAINAITDFLFNTRAGVAVLFVAGAIIFAIAAFILEKRTGALYVDRGPADPNEEDEGLFSGLFSDDDD